MADITILDGKGDDISNEDMDRHWHTHSVVVRPDADDMLDGNDLYHVILYRQGNVSNEHMVLMYEGSYDDCIAYAHKLRDLMLGKL